MREDAEIRIFIGIVLVALVVVLVIMGFAVKSDSDARERMERACRDKNMKLMSTEVWHGKIAHSYFMCVDGNGQTWAVEK